MNIGNFEDIAGMPNAQLRMRAFDLSAEELTPTALFLHHPMLSVLSVADGITTITKSSGDSVSYDISTGRISGEKAIPEATATATSLPLRLPPTAKFPMVKLR